MRNRFVATLFLILAFIAPATTQSVRADTVSAPSFNLDATNPASLATNSPTVWKDLVSNSIQLTLGANTSRSAEGGGSIQIAAANGSSGAYLAPVATGTPSNIVGSMTLMQWVKFTSWNTDWNIIASRWFSNFAGSGSGSDLDYHFSVRLNTSTYHKLNLYTTNSSDKWGSYDFSLNKWYLVGFTLDGSGNLQFYVNGQPDGSVQTGVTHTASTTSYLFVGDLRASSNCTACAANGYISKFRLWNSVLNASQISADYKNEAANYGYAPTLSLSLGNTSPTYRVTNSIAASISGPSSIAGRITFLENGKSIPNCKNRVVATSPFTCSWKPSIHGATIVTVNYNPSDQNFVSGKVSANYFVNKRTTNR